MRRGKVDLHGEEGEKKLLMRRTSPSLPFFSFPYFLDLLFRAHTPSVLDTSYVKIITVI